MVMEKQRTPSMHHCVVHQEASTAGALFYGLNHILVVGEHVQRQRLLPETERQLYLYLHKMPLLNHLTDPKMKAKTHTVRHIITGPPWLGLFHNTLIPANVPWLY